MFSGLKAYGFVLAIAFSSLARANDLVDCYYPNSGWGLATGAIGISCQANRIDNVEKAVRYYSPYALDGELIFNPVISANIIREYEDNVLDILEQVATDFYRERAILEKRDVSAQELDGWINAVLAVAYQESLHTHFQFDRRLGDPETRLNVLVGDAKCAVPYQQRPDGRWYCPQFQVNVDGMKQYSSLGMFQINLAVHSSESKIGFFDMVQNIQYGIAFYYVAWRKIINGTHNNMSACRDLIFSGPNGEIDYQKAAQAGYSVYNGGKTQVCRWAGDSPWKRNDDGYRNALEKRMWLKFSSDIPTRELRKEVVTMPDGTLMRRYRFPFDLQCLRDAGEDCML